MKKTSAAQKLANLFPEWSSIRSDEQSLGFQLLNVLGQPLDTIEKELIKQKANYYLSTANLGEIDLIHRFELVPSFTFDVNETDSSFASFATPSVSGLIGATWYPIALALNNDLESFWYTSVPSRYSSSITVSGTHVVLEPTQLVTSPITSFTSEINFPGFLYVTVSGGTTFLSVDNDQAARGMVQIEGKTRKGTEESESMIFLFDDTKVTTKEWTSISKVSVYSIEPSTATIKITCLRMNNGPLLDTWNLDESAGGQKVDSFWGLGVTPSGNASLDQVRFVSDSPVNLLAGITDKEVGRRVELMNTSGVIFTATDLAVESFTDKIWITTASDLLLFDRTLYQPSTAALTKKKYDSLVRIHSDYYYRVLGESITLSYLFARPIKDLAKHRVSVERPDGQKFGIVNGAFVTLNSGAWVFGANQDRRLRNDDEFDMTQRGDWVFTLEALMTDEIQETDQIIVSVQSTSALSGFSFPYTISGIAFDSDNKLWVGDTDGVKHRIDLATDNMLIDFERKVIYFKEQYEDIEVTA